MVTSSFSKKIKLNKNPKNKNLIKEFWKSINFRRRYEYWKVYLPSLRSASVLTLGKGQSDISMVKTFGKTYGENPVYHNWKISIDFREMVSEETTVYFIDQMKSPNTLSSCLPSTSKLYRLF